MVELQLSINHKYDRETYLQPKFNGGAVVKCCNKVQLNASSKGLKVPLIPKCIGSFYLVMLGM